ncbi:MAG: amidase family protein [Chloroflexota bacterium]|nr:amidase family protein [Chloroflexota bacterium]
MQPSEIAFLPAVELAARIRARELSPVEAVEVAIGQIEALNPLVNAVVTPAFEQARAAARAAEAATMRGDALGPLHGLPIGLKDMTETAGLRTTYGSTLYEHNVPTVDALLVTRLTQAGGIVIGKTNTPEFAAGSNTRNPVFGQTLNPWNRDLNPGGSSGGSAVALATGMCALAEGSDHGGSLRNPAAYCNVVGFRVSAGRIPAYPSPWVYDPFSVHGPMARTVRDAALMLSVMAGPDDRVPISISEPGEPFARACEGDVEGWRVAWTPDLDGLFRVAPEVRRLTEEAARRFADLGCIVEDASPDLHDALEIIVPLRAMRTGAVHQRELGLLDRVDNAWLKQFARRAEGLSALDVAAAEARRSRLWERVRGFMERYELLLLPSTQMAAFPKEIERPTEIDGRPLGDPIESSLATYGISITGLPALSVPCGFTGDGRPIGLQIVGRWRREADVLRAATAFEDAFPYHRRRPPLVEAMGHQT